MATTSRRRLREKAPQGEGGRRRGGTAGESSTGWTAVQLAHAGDSTKALEGASAPVVDQLRRAAGARKELAVEFGLLSSNDVAEFADSASMNRAATAYRWTRAGRVLVVPTGQGDRYPGFQFTDGLPKPVMRPILAAFDGKTSGWSVALWFVSANTWLGGRRPVDVLDDEPDGVVQAAEYAAGEIL